MIYAKKILFFYGTPVSVNMRFNVVLPLIEKVAPLMLMLVPAIRACERSRF